MNPGKWAHPYIDMQRMVAESSIPWQVAWIPRCSIRLLRLQPDFPIARTIFTRFVPRSSPEEMRPYYEKYPFISRAAVAVSINDRPAGGLASSSDMINSDAPARLRRGV
jgi:hypothetical protein